MFNPLYRLLAHRAMSDVPSEACTLAALAMFLWWWRRVWSGRLGVATVVLPCLAGACAGLSLLCKFSGFLGLMIIAAWTGNDLVRARRRAQAASCILGSGSVVTAMVALAFFVGLEPFHDGPATRNHCLHRCKSIASLSVWQRFDFQMKHRLQVSENQKFSFPHNALHTILRKTKVFAVQGFGRFGLLGPSDADSTVRFDRRQDLGAIFWGPLVFYGLVMAFRLGVSQYRSGQPPTALALAVWAIVAWTVVTVYLPMAWDRYLLPIQSANALLAGLAVAAIWQRVRADRVR